MKHKIKNLFHILSIGIILGFCFIIIFKNEYIFHDRYFHYKLHRLFLFTLQSLLNKHIALFGLWAVSLYGSLLLSIFLAKLFCQSYLKGMLEIHIKNRDRFIRVVCSTFVCLIFLVYDSWLINTYFIPQNILWIVILVNIVILPISVALWSLLIKGGWERLWHRILISKGVYLKIVNIISIALVFFVLLLKFGLYFDRIFNIPKGPNVILIGIDTLRADHLGCYGYNKDITPNIDEFSKDSVLFKNCIAQAPSTTSSFGSIFTSLIPSHHKASHSANTAISEDVITLSEFLKDENYRTISYNGGGQVSSIYGFDRGFDIYHSFSETGQDKFSLIVEQAIEWLEGHKEEKYFLFLHTYESHHPYTPQKNFLHSLESKYGGDLPDEISIELLEEINDGEMSINEQDLEHIINAYDGEIRSIDDAFGNFLQFLKKIGHYNDTLIIFTSDHGEEFNERRIVGWHSHSLYDELLKVPLLIKMPQSMHKGSAIAENIRSIDILPTILDLMNKNNLDYFSGISLMSLIRGNKVEDMPYAVSQLDQPESNIASIRDGKWKWYDYKLFDLLNDPEEKYDVYIDNKEIAEFLETKLNEIIDSSELFHTKSHKIEEEMSAALEEQLKSLGYL